MKEIMANKKSDMREWKKYIGANCYYYAIDEKSNSYYNDPGDIAGMPDFERAPIGN